MAIPIRHTTCGEIAMWYVGDKDDNVARSAHIVYLDGTRPMPCSGIPSCPHCRGFMSPVVNLKRCFDEDVDPGFDMQAALSANRTVSLDPSINMEKFETLVRQRDAHRIALFLMFSAVVVAVIVALLR